jgi:hypothetical protein
MSHLHVEPENTAAIPMVGDGMRGPAKFRQVEGGKENAGGGPMLRL